MKVYHGNSLGCTLWAVALTILFFVTAGVFIKLLVTTPLGLILLALMAYGYFRNRQRIREFTQTGGFYWTNGMNGANGQSDGYSNRQDASSNPIFGTPGQDPNLRSSYESADESAQRDSIDRSAYQDVQDADFVEIHDADPK